MLDELLELILSDAVDHMERSMQHLGKELRAVRAGRATPAMLQNVRVEFYGSISPLNQLSSINAPQPDLLVVSPWDKSSIDAIEKGILSANLGLNPSNDGVLIRVPVPPLTEERRIELCKRVRQIGERSKIAIRNIRRSTKDDLKTTQEEEHLSEDMRYLAEERLQKETDRFVSAIDNFLRQKEAEIMEV
ncbi:MAG: ribosome recycling factor [Rhodothermaceae bacterium]|uniref:Ribosome-recycling factor n=1 Tax=Boseongicola sp. SB0664_bin_43 TaxID=2604844 RepID=A0A6B0Y1D5_9RHOB|nr:ribosome recycling factor [Boseongicola sp. SB0664_bin_43]MYF64368.1 ribosome recycling factor [Rhodothermaceae bacterium]MYI84504.1 ribosome recycling factor [Rhodothermaceae bacterium]